MASELDKLDSIGRTLGSSDWLSAVLDKVDNLKDEIVKSFTQNHSESQTILQTIGVNPPKQTSSGYSFEITMDEAATYLDEGVRGASSEYAGIQHSRQGFTNKKPPVSALQDWSRRKGLNAYAVRESIFQKGIKPSKFYTNTVTDSRLEQLYKDIAKVTKDQMLIQIKQ